MTAGPQSIDSMRDPSEETLIQHDYYVENTYGVDQFCSSTRWMRPAHDAFCDGESMLCIPLDQGSALFREQTMSDGYVALLPLESVWELGSPIGCVHPKASMRVLFNFFLRFRRHWDFTLISGILPSSVLKAALLTECDRSFVRTRRMSDSVRDTLSLKDGVGPWMDRRSSGFRAKLRRADRECSKEGVAFEYLRPNSVKDAMKTFDRFVAIEQKSWKAAEGSGISTGPMQRFCRNVVEECAERSEIYGVVAKIDEVDVGFVYGARYGDGYRGLQMSYASECRHLSLGNVLQLRMIEWMAEIGCGDYDLGSSLPYKERWSDSQFHTESYILFA